MDIAAVRKALADTVRAALPELNCYPYVPARPDTPCFYVLGPEIAYDVTFGGDDEVEGWVCRLLVDPGEDEDAQALLDAYLSRGPTSVKLAIEGTPGVPQTLGGVCGDLHVRRAQNYGPIEHGDDKLLGADLLIHIVD